MATSLARRRQETPARLAVSETVRAAGGVVRRIGVDGPEVLLVHRPRYDDWTFPKGKRAIGETDEAAAVREVAEETGLACVLGPELAAVSYEDARGRPKVVRYWLMEPVLANASAPFAANDEVDELRWCSPSEARRTLTYDHDRLLLDRIAEANTRWRGGEIPPTVR